jgi:hypothetical protein
MLVKTGKDELAHIRKPGMEDTWCGQSIRFDGSTKGCELCDRCLDAVIQAEQEKADNHRIKIPVR